MCVRENGSVCVSDVSKCESGSACQSSKEWNKFGCVLYCSVYCRLVKLWNEGPSLARNRGSRFMIMMIMTGVLYIIPYLTPLSPNCLACVEKSSLLLGFHSNQKHKNAK